MTAKIKPKEAPLKECEVCEELLKPGQLLCDCEYCGKMFGPCCNSQDDGTCVDCA